MRWGDEVEGNTNGNTQMSSNGGNMNLGEGSLLPARVESDIDAVTGYKTITEYKYDTKGSKVKVTTIVEEKKVISRVSKAAMERRNWEKFGNVLTDMKNGQDNSNVTYISNEDVSLEDPNADMMTPGDKKEEASVFSGVKNSSIVSCRHCGMTGDHWTLKCPYKDTPVEDLAAAMEKDQDSKKEDAKNNVGATATTNAGGSGLAGAFGSAGGGKYVPPGQRAGASADTSNSVEDRDFATLRVTNISTETRDSDLQELFRTFGTIARIYLAKDRETFQSRGFAFISFHYREDAERAMNGLQGFGYDHLILKIEWAKPSAKPTANQDASGNLSTTFRSGYGKALPQNMAPPPRKG